MTSRSTRCDSSVGFRLRRGGRLEGGRTSGTARCIAVRRGRRWARIRARLAQVEEGEEAFQIAAAVVVAVGTVKVVAQVAVARVGGYSR